MRILLDEDVPVGLRHYFPSPFSVETVEYCGWKSLDNGDLLRRAAQHFDTFLTIDKGVSEQQNLDRFDLRFVFYRIGSDQIEDLAEHVGEICSRLRRGTERVIVIERG